MVRMDECVEALYDQSVMENRKKTLAIMKVMKGAISVSKSRTGECIFRHNKLENKKLEMTIKKFKSDTNYTLSRFDTKKKSVVGRWRTMLEKQTTCNSTRLFNEVLDIEDPDRKPVIKDGSDDDSYFKQFLGLRLQRSEFGANGVGLVHHKQDNREEAEETAENEPIQDEGAVYVTEKHARRKYSIPYRSEEFDRHKQRNVRSQSVSTSQPLRLPSLPNVSVIRSQTVIPKTETEKNNERPELLRDVTDWSEWRLNDKDWLLNYIKRQKTRHEDLIMRNALAKIEAEMSGSNTIRRHQIRARLQREDTMEASLKPKLVHSRSIEPIRVDKVVPKRLPSRTAERKSESFLTVRSLSDDEDMVNEKPRKLQKEMTKVSMRTLPEPLPMILENPVQKKKTANLPLITITKA